MTIPADFVEIGKIVAAHGIKGELRVYPNSDFPERFERQGRRWLLRPQRSEPEEVELLGGYFQEGKGIYVVRLKGVGDRNAAEALCNSHLLIPADDRPKLGAGEFLVADLIGLPIYQQQTQELVGTVTNVTTAGNDLLEVKLADSDRVILIPFVNPIVPVVDLPNRRIEITPPPGLLEL
jgi:16S rRNA processing protein RimM